MTNTASILLNSEKFKDFPLRLETGQALQCKSTIFHNFLKKKQVCKLFQHSTGSPSNSNKTRKRIQIGRKEVKLSLFSNDMTLYRKPYTLYQKTISTDKLIHKVAGCKKNI